MAITTEKSRLEQQQSVVFSLLSEITERIDSIEKALEPILTNEPRKEGEHAGEEGKTKLIGALFEINDNLESILKRIVL